MGNSCCPPANPCDHTVDETKGLLSSSESKNSTKAEGTGEVNCTEVAAEESKNEEPVHGQQVITVQPAVVNKPEQSSYSATISTLHTEVSLAALNSQSSSPEAPKEPVNATEEISETKKEPGVEDVWTADDALTGSVKAPVETVLAEGMDTTKVQTTDVIVKVDESAESVLTEQEGPVEIKKAPLEVSEEDMKKEAAEGDLQKEVTAVDVQNEVVAIDVQKKAAAVAVELMATEVEDQKEKAVMTVPKEAALVEEQKEAAVVTAQEEAEVQKMAAAPKEAAVDEKKKEAAKGQEVQKEETEVDNQNEAAEDIEKKAADTNVQEEEAEAGILKMVDTVDIQKEASEVDVQKEESEVDVQKEESEVDVQKEESEEKPNPPVDGLIEKQSEHLTPTDVAQKSNKAESSLRENGEEEHQISPPELNVAEESVPVKVFTEKPVEEPTNKVRDKYEEHIAAAAAEGKGDNLPSETQKEHSGVVISPAADISSDVTPHTVENGQGDSLKVESQLNVDAALVSEMSQETEQAQKIHEETSHIETEAQLPETTASINSSVEQMEMSKPSGATEDLEKTAEGLLNGLDSSTAVEKVGSTETHGDAVQLGSVEPTEKEAISLDEHVQEEDEPEHQLSEKEKEEATVLEPIEKEVTESHKVQKGEIILSSSHAVEVALIPVTEKEEEQPEDEDLYRGAEEIEDELPKEKQSKPLLEFTIPGVEERCSLAAAVDILAYSEREWKGNTAKSTLIRKGYSEMSCSFSGLRRVRGDNYCALRATLFQVLTTTTQIPAWLQKEDFTSLPEKLEAQEHLIGGWRFPAECGRELQNPVEKLKHYMELLQKRWQAAAETVSPEKRQHLCEHVFQSGEEEYGLLEVLKFLMLATAVELHGQMLAGQEVPVFCWLLFARDTSETPKTLLNNHLSQVGFSGGLEQVEMFLLGYALQHTIQTFRLYKMDTEEFVTHYPDDHKQDWPCVCIVTEDDRHYNVPIRKQAQHQLNHDLSVPWPDLS